MMTSTPEYANAVRMEHEIEARRQALVREAQDACRPQIATRPPRWTLRLPTMPTLGRIFAHGRA